MKFLKSATVGTLKASAARGASELRLKRFWLKVTKSLKAKRGIAVKSERSKKRKRAECEGA